jgi:hypothetical protein
VEKGGGGVSSCCRLVVGQGGGEAAGATLITGDRWVGPEGAVLQAFERRWRRSRGGGG